MPNNLSTKETDSSHNEIELLNNNVNENGDILLNNSVKQKSNKKRKSHSECNDSEICNQSLKNNNILCSFDESEKPVNIPCKKRNKSSSLCSDLNNYLEHELQNTYESHHNNSPLKYKKKSKKRHIENESTDENIVNLQVTNTEQLYPNNDCEQKKSKKKDKKELIFEASSNENYTPENESSEYTDIHPEVNAIESPVPKRKKSKSEKKKNDNSLINEDDGLSFKYQQTNMCNAYNEEECNDDSKYDDNVNSKNKFTYENSSKPSNNANSQDASPHPESELKFKAKKRTRSPSQSDEFNNARDYNGNKIRENSRKSFEDYGNSDPNYRNRNEKPAESIFEVDYPLKSRGRPYTVSIAVPVSILEQSILKELQTVIIGQIARAACIYSIDEIVIYDDNCWQKMEPSDIRHAFGMMKMILEYQECPQYIRRPFFPFHQYTRHVGILNPLNAPHHLRRNEWCDYREGISLDGGKSKITKVNIGLGYPADVNCEIEPGVRVTVKLSPESRYFKRMFGTAVAPHEPRTKGGLYWGYTVREANSLSEAVNGGYDLIIGTSDKGSEADNFHIKKFKRALIVFGGMEGLEAALNYDDNIKEKDPKKYFKHYVNTCPTQTSRTIRTEEAVLISLSVLHPKLFT